MDTPALAAARRSGLVAAGRPLLVMLSGGADSVCLLDVAVRLGARVSALHVNYGLRPDADADEQHCRELCERLGVPLTSERVALDAGGNLQARARDARYALAEGLAEGDFAAAHTSSDQAETIVYRLVSSPGHRALIGMRPRRGRLVRPLLEASRAETRAHCRAAGLEWREDASNADPRFARARIRAEVMPVLREIAPALERTLANTSRELAEELDLLDALADAALAELGSLDRPVLADVAALTPPLPRLVLQRLAALADRRAPALTAGDAEAILALAGRGGSLALDLTGGRRVVIEYGAVSFGARQERAVTEQVALAVPGIASFGEWEVEASVEGAGDVALARAALGDQVVLRAWREGDRMRPSGLGGTKKLQDLFVDRKVPRALRRSVPVVEARGEIAWVPGVAAGEGFLARAGEQAVGLSARRVGPDQSG